MNVSLYNCSCSSKGDSSETGVDLCFNLVRYDEVVLALALALVAAAAAAGGGGGGGCN